ncbi:MAG: filamentous hemagglutinin N-terminal domain-containing protein [Proteus mirabilis]|nr:filamentous hemagglutinin N-terminal domain-containing protein [Proteus mirabilis]HEK2070437.1 filamentous hemagglutinin N-terminal domain-containing protein [Proteus mirabilis]
MKKNSLFTVSLLSAFISLSCYAHQDVTLNADSLSDARVSVSDDTGKTQVEVINTNQDNIAHIYYDRFDVSDDGLLLKNDKAELIINEVVSKKRSMLEGELELQGKKATVVIANPNGISCNNCSFSGFTESNSIKLITGSSTGKFSKQFTLTDELIDFRFTDKITKNEFSHFHRHYKDISSRTINIISNHVLLANGDFNAEYIRFDLGLTKFNLKDKNIYNKRASLDISKEAELNSRNLIIAGYNSSVSNRGDINTLSLIAAVDYWENNDRASISINTDDNLYRTPYDDMKKSKLIVSGYYFGSDKSSFDIKNSKLDIYADTMYLDKYFTIDNSYLIADVNDLNVFNITLKQSYFDITAQNDINIDGKIGGEGRVVLEGNGGNFNDKGKIALTGKGSAGLKGQPKFKLGTSNIIYKGN